MDEKLARAFDALQQAHEAGNAEDAQQLADYIRTLQAEATATKKAEEASAEKKQSMVVNPATVGAVGAAAGLVGGPYLTSAVDALTPAPLRPGAPKITPQVVAPPAAPISTPPLQPAETYHTPHGLGTGAMKNIEHNIGQKIGNPLHAELLKNDPMTRGYTLRGNSLIFTPSGADIGAPIAPAASATPAAPQTIPLTAKQRAMAALQASKPVSTHRMGNVLGTGLAAGLTKDMLEQAQQGNIGQATVSGLGAVGGIAAQSSNPRLKALGYLSALGAPAVRYMSEKDKKAAGGAIPGYAGGGLAYLSKGKKVMEAFEYGGKQLGKLSDWAQDYIGSYFVPTQSDRMRYVGGPSFSANQLARPEYKDIVWGSGKPGTATGIANLAKDPRFGGVENQIFAPLLGEAKMHQSNKMIFDRMVEEFFRNPEKLTPELRQTINDYIRSGGLTVGGAKKSKSFEPIPEFDVADRQMIENLGKTFDNRKLIAQHAFGGEGIGGRKSQIIPYEKILQETTDPTVLGAPTFSMGPRAFKLTGETLDVPRPDLNAAFPYKLFGQDLGVTYPPVPSELSLMDFQRQWRQDTGKTMPRKSGALPQPGYYEHTMGYTPAGSSERIYPRQKMTENWVKELQRSGFNQGGLTE